MSAALIEYDLALASLCGTSVGGKCVLAHAFFRDRRVLPVGRRIILFSRPVVQGFATIPCTTLASVPIPYSGTPGGWPPSHAAWSLWRQTGCLQGRASRV